MSGFKPGPAWHAYYRARQRWRDDPTPENAAPLRALFLAKIAERDRDRRVR